MKRLLLLAVVLAAAISAADKKKKQPKPPEVVVIETTAHRTEGRVMVDGRVKNNSEKRIEGLVLLFDFLAPGRAVITTQKGPIDEEVLDPGKEAVFRVELNDPVRAVEVQLGAVDRNSRDLRVGNPGPFAIE